MREENTLEGDRRMRLFLSTYTNRIDKKGRVSVPASFRTIITSQSLSEVIAYPSIGDEPCIDCCDYFYFEKLAEGIDAFGPYTDEHQAFATSILGDSYQLAFDSEGRIMLPEFLIEFAGLDGMAAFVGRGKTFQIWNPERYEPYRKDSRKMAQARRDALQPPPRTGEAS